MPTVRATDVNRKFSNILTLVSQGEEFLVVSRGKPVATIIPVRKADKFHLAARQLLFDRLSCQEVTGDRIWTRDELYAP